VGLKERNDARSLGNGATWAFGLGGAALAAGVVVWLTGGSSSGDAHAASLELVPAVSPSFAGASMQGSW
jgi:hypothetical protein